MPNEHTNVNTLESVSWSDRLLVWAWWDNFYQVKANDAEVWERAKQKDIEEYFYKAGKLKPEAVAALKKKIADDKHHNSKFRAYIAGMAVTFFIAFASAAAVADAVVSNVALGLLPEAVLAIAVSVLVFAANVYIFKRVVADMMKRLGSFNKWVEGLVKKNDTIIELDKKAGDEPELQLNLKQQYDSAANNYDLKGGQKAIYWIGLGCAAIYAAAVAALNFEKAPVTMENMLSTSHVGFEVLAGFLGVATFFAYFALLSLPMIKLAQNGGPKEGLGNYFRNLFALDDYPKNGTKYEKGAFIASRALAVLLVVAFVSSAVWGLAMTNLAQNFSLMSLFGLTGDASTAGIVIGMVFGTIGKLPFVMMAALNMVKISGRICRLGAWKLKELFGLTHEEPAPRILKENTFGNASGLMLVVIFFSAFFNGFISADGASQIPGIDAKDKEVEIDPDDAVSTQPVFDEPIVDNPDGDGPSIQPIVDSGESESEAGLGDDKDPSLILDPKDDASRAAGILTLWSGMNVSANSAMQSNEPEECKRPATSLSR